MLITIIIILTALIIISAIAIVIAGWREKVKGADFLSAMQLGRELSPKPHYSKRVPIEDTIKRIKGQRGVPIFVVPVAEFRRVNVEGAGDIDRRIDDKQFVTLTPISWNIFRDYHEKGVISAYGGYLPPGVVTDFASIPWLTRKLAGEPTGKVVRAAIVHDYGYRCCNTQRTTEDKMHWDKGLLYLMREDGVTSTRRILIYAAVRLFGRSAWKSGTILLKDEKYQQALLEIKRITDIVVKDFYRLFDGESELQEPVEIVGYQPSLYKNVIQSMQEILGKDTDT